MEKSLAFKILDGAVCCGCLAELCRHNKMKLGSADWDVDGDAVPCVACWTKVEEEREKTGESETWRGMSDTLETAMKWFDVWWTTDKGATDDEEDEWVGPAPIAEDAEEDKPLDVAVIRCLLADAERDDRRHESDEGLEEGSFKSDLTRALMELVKLRETA